MCIPRALKDQVVFSPAIGPSKWSFSERSPADTEPWNPLALPSLVLTSTMLDTLPPYLAGKEPF
ncbi:MAG: hypothetical protein MR575_02235 [Bacteroides sp.]|nr:hypothetical protein [Bacteroides sp.]